MIPVPDKEARRLIADADRRMRALNSSVVKGAAKKAAKKKPRRKRGESS